MTESEFAQIHADVLAVSTRHDSDLHGQRHWRAVAHAGLHLAPQVDGCEPLLVLLFALFHDAMRQNEGTDPEHGQRGGQLAQHLLTGRLTNRQLTTVYEACRDHTEPRLSDDSTIGVCWDADRLNLWRVGTEPDPQYLSTRPARDPELIRRARDLHHGDYHWDDLTRLSLELSPT